MSYVPDKTRYDNILYNRCGRSGIKLPVVSLGLWHNFGGVNSLENAREMLHKAFDLGITHFDLANNYGPPAGSAEKTFGHILLQDFIYHRDELIVSTKAGWGMWPGPYGDFGSRKYLVASLDQSLRRMGLDYVDIFYHHRPDPETPIEETMGALDYIVRSGRALYIGISSYDAEETKKAVKILNDLGTPCLIHQPSYSMLNRWIEDGLTKVLGSEGIGCIVFSPLAQGMLTSKYLSGIPEESRAANKHGFLTKEQVTDDVIRKAKKLNTFAKERGQTLAQLAIAWVLRLPEVTSALIGASNTEQIEDCVNATKNLAFSDDEIKKIESILGDR